MQDSWRSHLTVRSLLMGTLLCLLALSGMTQCVIGGGDDNLWCTGLTVLSSGLMLVYLWRSDAMRTHPISSLALLGFTASSQFVGLLTQSASGQPFIEHLRAPLLTFSVLAVAHATAVSTHAIYRHFLPLRNASMCVARRVYSPLQVHRIPRPVALWAMSVIGLIAMIKGGGDMGDAGGKLLVGIQFLMWMPFLIPLYGDMLGEQYGRWRLHLPWLVAYGLGIMAVALLKNYRAMMFVGPLQLCFVFLVYKCRTPQRVTGRQIAWVVTAAVALALTMPTLSDLMVAMQMARANRDKVSSTELLKDTWEAWTDAPRLELFKQRSEVEQEQHLYDELYLSNPILNRFSETKFHDNMLFFGQHFEDDQRQALWQDQVQRMIAILPQNVLDALELHLDKRRLVYSNGDMYLSLSHGAPLGGFVTGSIWADLYVLTGAWMPFATFVMLILTFIVLDALSRFGPGLFISPVAMCSLWQIYMTGIGGESIVAKALLVFRTSLQQVLLYALVLGGVRLVMGLMRVEVWVPASRSSADLPDEALAPPMAAAAAAPWSHA